MVILLLWDWWKYLFALLAEEHCVITLIDYANLLDDTHMGDRPVDETIQGLYQLLIVAPVGVNVTITSFKCNVNSEHVVSPLVGGVHIIQ